MSLSIIQLFLLRILPARISTLIPCRRTLAVALLLPLSTLAPLSAAAPSWVYNPSRVGNVLVEGGWMLEYRLGEVGGTSEYSFPIQLIYQNNHSSRSIFGSQWFCPQLESTLIPQGAGTLVWTRPDGSKLGFMTDPIHSGTFISYDGVWHLNRSGSDYEISDAEGWKYSYNRGFLIRVESPTGRALEFEGTGTPQVSVVLHDAASGVRRVLLATAAGENKCVAVCQVNGQTHRFAYVKDGADDRLVAWAPPVGNSLKFYYKPDTSTLYHVETLDGAKVVEGDDFQTAFSSAPGANTSRHDPASYSLQSDPGYTYSAGSGQVTATSRTGVTLAASESIQRGVMTSREGDVETKSYYYVAPGQKYNGKLRRVEKDGRIQVEYRYDRKTGLLSEIIDANGTITFFEYPAQWHPYRAPLLEPKPIRVLRGTRASKEVVAEYGYDECGRVIAARDASGLTTRYSYDQRGQLQSVIGPDGRISSFGYDGLGRPVTVTHDKLMEQIQYDDFGRVRSRISSDRVLTEYAYNEHGQLLSVTRAGKLVAQYQYDDKGNPVGQTDPLGRVRNTSFDAKGHLLSETAPNGSVTRYEYDAFGRRTAQIDGDGNRITFDYDGAGHLVKQVNPLNQTLTWAYDSKGHLTAKGNGEQNINFTYNSAGRLTKLDFGNGQTIGYAYDPKGEMLSAVTPDARNEFTYDRLGNITAIRFSLGTGQETTQDTIVHYRYNLLGQRTGLLMAEWTPATPAHGDFPARAAHYEPIQQTEYTYDSEGRLSSIVSNGQPIVSYHYDAQGRPVQKSFGNGITASLSYDADGRLADEKFTWGPAPATPEGAVAPGVPATFGTGSSSTTSASSFGIPGIATAHAQTSSPSLDLNYQWDAANQLLSRTWNGETQVYGYDPAGQLLSVKDGTDGTLLESYAYDKAGNMTRKVIGDQKTTMRYDAGNQLVASFDGDTPPKRGASGVVASAVAVNSSGASTPSAPSATSAVSATESATASYFGSAPGSTGTSVASSTAAASPAQNASAPTPPLTPSVASGSTASTPPPPPQYTYDQAGRLVNSPGGFQRTYGWLDKVVTLTTPAGQTVRYTYWPDGQLASKVLSSTTAAGPIQTSSNGQSSSNVQPSSGASASSASESFLWDGLALIRRNDTIYIIEPHPSGGVPIASYSINAPDHLTWYLNDMLGTTLATVDDGGIRFEKLTAFGQPARLAANSSQGSGFRSPNAPAGLGTTGTTAPNPVPSLPTLSRKL